MSDFEIRKALRGLDGLDTESLIGVRKRINRILVRRGVEQPRPSTAKEVFEVFTRGYGSVYHFFEQGDYQTACGQTMDYAKTTIHKKVTCYSCRRSKKYNKVKEDN